METKDFEIIEVIVYVFDNFKEELFKNDFLSNSLPAKLKGAGFSKLDVNLLVSWFLNLSKAKKSINLLDINAKKSMRRSIRVYNSEERFILGNDNIVFLEDMFYKGFVTIDARELIIDFAIYSSCKNIAHDDFMKIMLIVLWEDYNILALDEIIRCLRGNPVIKHH